MNKMNNNIISHKKNKIPTSKLSRNSILANEQYFTERKTKINILVYKPKGSILRRRKYSSVSNAAEISSKISLKNSCWLQGLLEVIGVFVTAFSRLVEREIKLELYGMHIWSDLFEHL